MRRHILSTCRLIALGLLAFAPLKIAAPAYAQKEDEFFVELALNHIDITTGFTGAEIRLFGYRKYKDSEIAIYIKGPEKNMTIWKKAKVLGAWVNRYSETYKHMPLYYDYALGKPEEDTAKNESLFLKNGIGVLSLFPVDQRSEKTNFRDALIADREKSRLYPIKPKEIRFLNENFFRVTFQVPAAAPTGQYSIESFLIKNGKILERDTESLAVEQVGLNAFLFNAAKDQAVLYALSCIVFALVTGWFFSAIRVKP